jgi:hypothetical protein
MAIVITEIHAAPSRTALNQEWFVVENRGEKPFSTAGCTVSTGKKAGQRLKPIGQMDPGFTLASGDKVRVITGNPGKKAQGEPPAEDGGVKNYHLFHGELLLSGPGTMLAVSLKQHELTRATFDPGAPAGVLSSKNGATKQ